jgi:hypothetical protein
LATEELGSWLTVRSWYINFHAASRDADAYRQAHPGMATELLSRAEATDKAGRTFGGLLHPRPGGSPPSW